MVLVLPHESRLNFALNSCGSTTFVVFLVLQSLWYLLSIILTLTIAAYLDVGTLAGIYFSRIALGLLGNFLSIYYWSRWKSLSSKNKQLAIEDGNVLLA